MAGWTLDLDKWAEKQKSDMLDVKRTFALMLFTKVVQRTPVDSGAHRQNWLVTINQESFEYDPSLQDGKSDRVNAQARSKVLGSKPGDTIILQNNGPAIRKLEYGGYGPNSPTGKTVGGFSKQAPRGMVGITMLEAGAVITEAIAEVKS